MFLTALSTYICKVKRWILHTMSTVLLLSVLVSQLGVFSFQYECCGCHESSKDISIGAIHIVPGSQCAASADEPRSCCKSHKSAINYEKQNQDYWGSIQNIDFNALELDLFLSTSLLNELPQTQKATNRYIAHSPPLIQEDRVIFTCQFLI